jgi:radical SAM superfamily enzyme YgiQ (UPF0313 family)
MSIKKNILFIQLPLLDHSLAYIQGNIPYAGAAISGYLRRQRDISCTTEPLPFVLENFASDDVILKYIEKADPDIVAFSTFLWNLERNLELARRISEANPRRTVIFGGPEISMGSHALSRRREQVDWFVNGEGEWFFHGFLRGGNFDRHTEIINGNRFTTQPSAELLDAKNMVEPFTAGMLNPMPDGSIFMELTRGCPYRCSYCYYSRNCTSVREAPFENLLRAISDSRRLSEIYILSPTLDRSRDFQEKLKALASMNHGVRLHSEMRTGSIDISTARLLEKAGFRSMEVGLQTLNREVLSRVRRGSDPEKELRGMESMREAGIDLKIGIIPGLPGETPESFLRTIDRLVEMDFGQETEFYPLMILPGTAIRDEALRDGVSFQEKPPYFYLDGWGMSMDDIQVMTQELENRTGLSQSLTSLPDFHLNESGYLVKSIHFDGDRPGSWSPEIYLDSIETACFEFHIRCENESILLPGLRELMRGLPRGVMFTLVLQGNRPFQDLKLLDMVRGQMEEDIAFRLNIFNEFRDASRFRFFHVLDDPEKYFRAWQDYFFINPILKIGAENAESALMLLSENDPSEHSIQIEKGLQPQALKEILPLYREFPEMAAYEEKELQRLFYQECGFDFLELPFDFRKKILS